MEKDVKEEWQTGYGRLSAGCMEIMELRKEYLEIMIPISIKEFARKTAQHNNDINEKELIDALEVTLEAKKKGAKCCQCGQPIWAAGSAVIGMNMCFTCTTLETDDSEDYEVID